MRRQSNPLRRYLFPTIQEQLTDKIRRMQQAARLAEKYRRQPLLKYFFLIRKYRLHKTIYRRHACDITPEAVLGEVVFRHPLGIVIGGGRF